MLQFLSFLHQFKRLWSLWASSILSLHPEEWRQSPASPPKKPTNHLSPQINYLPKLASVMRLKCWPSEQPLPLWCFSAPSIMNCTVRDVTDGFFSVFCVSAGVVRILKNINAWIDRKKKKQRSVYEAKFLCENLNISSFSRSFQMCQILFKGSQLFMSTHIL